MVLSRAVETLYPSVGSDFDIIIIYNLAIFHLIRKTPDILASTMYIHLVIDELSKKPYNFWLNLTQIKQGCLHVLQQIKKVSWDFDAVTA